MNPLPEGLIDQLQLLELRHQAFQLPIGRTAFAEVEVLLGQVQRHRPQGELMAAGKR